jgi:hypothetical protein
MNLLKILNHIFLICFGLCIISCGANQKNTVSSDLAKSPISIAVVSPLSTQVSSPTIISTDIPLATYETYIVYTNTASVGSSLQPIPPVATAFSIVTQDTTCQGYLTPGQVCTQAYILLPLCSVLAACELPEQSITWDSIRAIWQTSQSSGTVYNTTSLYVFNISIEHSIKIFFSGMLKQHVNTFFYTTASTGFVTTGYVTIQNTGSPYTGTSFFQTLMPSNNKSVIINGCGNSLSPETQCTLAVQVKNSKFPGVHFSNPITINIADAIGNAYTYSLDPLVWTYLDKPNISISFMNLSTDPQNPITIQQSLPTPPTAQVIVKNISTVSTIYNINTNMANIDLPILYDSSQDTCAGNLLDPGVSCTITAFLSTTTSTGLYTVSWNGVSYKDFRQLNTSETTTIGANSFYFSVIF